MPEIQSQPLASSKHYTPAGIVLELDVECRASSSLGLPELDGIEE